MVAFTLNDEAKLIEKLRRIEALFAGTTFEGERNAAAAAMERIQRKFRDVQQEDPAIEYQFSMRNMWSRRLFVALLRRYGIRPYRYCRQRRTTVVARVPASFLDRTLWPEFQELNQTLQTYLDDVTTRVIAESIHGDASEAEVRDQSDGETARLSYTTD